MLTDLFVYWIWVQIVPESFQELLEARESVFANSAVVLWEPVKETNFNKGSNKISYNFVISISDSREDYVVLIQNVSIKESWTRREKRSIRYSLKYISYNDTIRQMQTNLLFVHKLCHPPYTLGKSQYTKTSNLLIPNQAIWTHKYMILKAVARPTEWRQNEKHLQKLAAKVGSSWKIKSLPVIGHLFVKWGNLGVYLFFLLGHSKNAPFSPAFSTGKFCLPAKIRQYRSSMLPIFYLINSW